MLYKKYEDWKNRKEERDKNWKNFDKQSMKRSKSSDYIKELWKYYKVVNARIGESYPIERRDVNFIKNIRKKKNDYKSDYNKATTEESAKQLKRQYLSEFDRRNNISDRFNFNKRNMNMYKKPMDNRIIHSEHCNHCLDIVRNKHSRG